LETALGGKGKADTVPDIPLTEIASLTILFIESEMFGALQFGEAPAVSKHQAWLCLLLANLFLYNPFLAGADCFGGLNLCHPPSNRATIGSSELQQFRVTNGRSTFAISEAALIEFHTSLPEPSVEVPCSAVCMRESVVQATTRFLIVAVATSKIASAAAC
jgi:hypothetical protein